MIHSCFRKALVALLLVGAANVANAQSNVNVFLKTGGVETVKVENSGLIFFEGNVMKILTDNVSAAPVAFALPAIQKVTFQDASYAPRIIGDGEAVLYPTVAENEVFIANAPASLKQVQIFDVTGKVVLSAPFRAGQPVAVGSLSAGIYVLKADALTFKFQKK
ncbi:MAG: T9SS type A sorting domain-containing protein [Paludibacteraceae bacterium]|nr:T9SS type A sorting domain-containing protein [Paludibacteraceae bacterium]MBP3716251.1 T9SS type A sorting domain-containing protein [Paludibacteraceae bacterium]